MAALQAAFDERAVEDQGFVLGRFDAAAQRSPDAVAVTDPRRSYTYAALAALIDDIAAAIDSTAGDRAGPVAILLPGEARYPAAMLGAFAAGRGFVPLDAAHPIERNRRIAAHSGAACVVVAGSPAGLARDLLGDDVPIVDLDALPDRTSRWRRPPLRSEEPACIVYTSGSTGVPKGVWYDQRGFDASIMFYVRTFRLTSADRFGAVSSLAVIATIRDIFSAFASGASIHILPPHELQPLGIARALAEKRITVFATVPTLFRHVLAAMDEAGGPDALRIVVLTGEPPDWLDYDGFAARFQPSASMIVRLASTEAPGYLWWAVDTAFRGEGARLPVGRPVPEISVALLDAAGQPVAEGELGEIVVTGECLSLGYWRDPEGTARAYSSDPSRPNVRTFRTGDLARRRPDGLYEFAGRKDAQVNLRGHRIEPGEIESALRALPPVRDAAIVVRRAEDGDAMSLAAYVELEPGTRGLLPRHLLAMLGRVLPPFMVPAQIVVTDALPRLPGFKIDRKALAALDARRAHEAADGTGDALTDEIARVMEQVLGRAGATPEDSLASLGGDSLQAVEVIAELEARFGVEIPSEDFAAAESIRELAAWIGRQAA